MDELWQRYRSFWRPVLFGLGVFLLGLIVVHIITPSPEEAADEAAGAANQLKAADAPQGRRGHDAARQRGGVQGVHGAHGRRRWIPPEAATPSSTT